MGVVKFVIVKRLETTKGMIFSSKNKIVRKAYKIIVSKFVVSTLYPVVHDKSCNSSKEAILHGRANIDHVV